MREIIYSNFNKLNLHDSKLVSFALTDSQDENGGDEGCFVLRIQRLDSQAQNSYSPLQIIFTECAYIKIEMDIAVFAMCSHDIAGTSCNRETPLLKELIAQGDPAYHDKLQFTIALIPPSGRIDVVAKDFRLKQI